MGNQLEETYGRLILYIVISRLLYARWKNSEIPTKEEWILKIMELTKMAKLTFMTKDKTTNTRK